VAAEEFQRNSGIKKEYFKMNGQRRLTEWPGEVDNLAPGQKLVSGRGQIQLTHIGTVGPGAVVCWVRAGAII
jgi:hypothetical protein